MAFIDRRQLMDWVIEHATQQEKDGIITKTGRKFVDVTKIWVSQLSTQEISQHLTNTKTIGQALMAFIARWKALEKEWGKALETAPESESESAAPAAPDTS